MVVTQTQQQPGEMGIFVLVAIKSYPNVDRTADLRKERQDHVKLMRLWWIANNLGHASPALSDLHLDLSPALQAPARDGCAYITHRPPLVSLSVLPCSLALLVSFFTF